MFTYLKLKNFKSFHNLEINFKKTKSIVKNLVVIYGENGAGKTNIIEAFKFLKDSIITLNVNDQLSNMFKDFKNSDLNENEKELFFNLLNKRGISSFHKMMENYRMINSEKNTEIEYGFNINGKDGYYKLVFKEFLICEELYYTINQNRGVVFKIQNNNNSIDSIYINPNVVINKNFENEINEKIYKFWGKHTLLSILVNELLDKNKEYVYNSLNENLMYFLYEILEIIVDIDSTITVRPLNEITEFFDNLIKGEISVSLKQQLLNVENILYKFFTSLMSDVKDVKYKTNLKDGKLEYELFFIKQIGGKLREIPFEFESTGTKKILSNFSSLFHCINGSTVLIDELDTGIHDLLVYEIIDSLKDYINGQLIFTTHNTLLLDKINKSNVYVLRIDADGEKELNCIDDFEKRTQKTNSIREKYLHGSYYGIPLTSNLNFDDWKYSYINADINEKKD